MTDAVLVENGVSGHVTDLLDAARFPYEVFSDVANNRKFVCVDPHAIPAVAVVDADMMDRMPTSLKVATGLDALTHAIEGYTTLGAWELTDTLHLRAIEIIGLALPAAAAGDPDAVERMALAQYMAGMGFSNVGLGLVHAMAHPLGAMYDAPHGVANGVLLASVMEYNAGSTGERLRHVAAALGVTQTASMPLEAARASAVAAVRRLVSGLGNPTTLGELGVTEDGLDALTDAALADVCAGGNPRPATREDVLAIYRSLLEGREGPPVHHCWADPGGYYMRMRIVLIYGSHRPGRLDRRRGRPVVREGAHDRVTRAAAPPTRAARNT